MDLSRWFTGDLSAGERIWTALLPGIAILIYFVGGAIAYMVRYAIKGPYHDQEMEGRGSSAFLGMGIRRYFAWIMQPIFLLLTRTGLPPFSITVLSFLLAVGAAVALAAGRFALGGWLYLFSGGLDFFDGRLARHSGSASRQGAALDSVLDRWGDGLVFAGLAWFYQGTWVLAPVLGGMLGSFLVSYTRARGEGLGVPVKVGLMQRAERIVYLGVMVALSPVLEAILVPADESPPHRLAVLGICIVGATSLGTAVHRFVYLLRALSRPMSQSEITRSVSGLQSQLAWNVFSSMIATAVDFLLVISLVDSFNAAPAGATALGCLLGGAVNYTVNRTWAFRCPPAGPLSQAGRYTLTSATSAILNAGGVAVLLLLPGLHYQVAWLLARLAVFLAWSFPLMRGYVFAGCVQPDRVEHGV